ncbi:MAG: JmjC domain-containing protein [Actinomycetota bacterium]
MNERAAPTLSGLLAPTSVSEFTERYWERGWLHVAHPARSGYRGLIDLADLDRLVAFHRHPTIPPFSLAENGPVRPQAASSGVRDAAEALRARQTIFVGALHERWDPAARLCSALAAELRHPVGATLVVSPAGVQGLQAHFDAADVFVLQLEGEKVWRIGPPERPLPLPGDPLAADAALSETASEVRLGAGDLLYVPRGFPHLAFTETHSHSAHLSIYIETVRWKQAVARALDLAAERSVELRRGLPPGALATPDAQTLAQELHAHIEAVLDELDPAEVLTRLGGDLIREMPVLPDRDLAGAVTAPEITPHSEVARRDGAVCVVRETSAQAAIDFPGASVAAPAHLAPALRYVAAHARFTVADVPGLSDSSKVVLVRRLVKEGLLGVVERRDGERGRDGRPADEYDQTREVRV